MSKPTKTHAEQLDQFFTSEKVAQRIIDWSGLGHRMSVLEPSAGGGAFVRLIPKNVYVTAVEMDPEMAAKLTASRSRTSLAVVCADFAKWHPQNHWDVGIMNPPYSGGLDGIHIAHALKFCDRVIALVRANVEYGCRRFERVFRTAKITRKAVLVNRPPFGGPADKGDGPRSDHEVIELVKRRKVWTPTTIDRTAVEWWADDWR